MLAPSAEYANARTEIFWVISSEITDVIGIADVVAGKDALTSARG